MLLWNGWADEHITPIGAIAYYEAMQRTMGQSSMDAFMRMYLAPGVAHCGNGEGLASMDMVSAMIAWAEQGTVPDAITTNRVDAAGTVTSSRPMYPYPAVAQYNGSGDPNAMASYSKGSALYTAPVPDWTGVDFYSPYAAAPL